MLTHLPQFKGKTVQQNDFVTQLGFKRLEICSHLL